MFFRAFTNGSSANIKFSKTHLSKMIKSGEYLTDICGIASAIDSFVNFPIWNGTFILKKIK